MDGQTNEQMDKGALSSMPVQLQNWRIYQNTPKPLYNTTAGIRSKKSCLCWGFTAQSTQWGHVERGQFT